MRLTYRPIERWPRPPTTHRQPNPFKADWQATLKLLDAELRHLDVTEAVLQVDSASEQDFRIDGTMRANARLGPRIILSCEVPGVGAVTYPCDAFEGRYHDDPPDWQINVRAVALGLEALRKLDRYGIVSNRQQYTGWKALGAGTPLGQATSDEMTSEQAARFLAEHAWMAGDSPDDTWRPWGPQHRGYMILLHSPAEVAQAWRLTARRLHPDTPVTGSPDLFRKATRAHETLVAHHGGQTK